MYIKIISHSQVKIDWLGHIMIIASWFGLCVNFSQHDGKTKNYEDVCIWTITSHMCITVNLH